MSKKIEIPGDMVEEILARLPAKSLLRFACVSKAWSSMFRNPTFISKHLLNGASGIDHALFNLRLFRFETIEFSHKFKLLEPPPDLGNRVNLGKINGLYIVGQCHGLICYRSGFKKPRSDSVTRNLVLLHLWNPATGQSKILSGSNILPLPPSLYVRRDRFGFGHDPKSGDYKVVRFAIYDGFNLNADRSECRVEAEVYSLRTDSWRRVTSSPFVLKGTPNMKSTGTCLGGFCYWTGETFSTGDTYTFSGCVPMIVSYNLSTEVFRQYRVPELVHPYPYPYHPRMASKLFEWKGSLALVMFPFPGGGKDRFIDIWSFEAGVDGPVTLQKHLDLDLEENLDGMHVETTALNDVEFLLNDDLILTYNIHYSYPANFRGTTSEAFNISTTTLKAFNISTRQMRNISSVKIGINCFTLQIVGYNPSLVSLFS